MKSPVVYTVLIAVIYVMVAVAQMTEDCPRPDPCTSIISIAPTALHHIINSAECSGSQLGVSWNRRTPDGCLITSLYLTYNCFSSGGEVLTETLLPADTVTSVSRNLSVMEPSSIITECQINGHYISSDDCVELLQPKRVNCSAEHHMATPTLSSDSEHDHLAELTTTNEHLQPRTTKFSDDLEGNSTATVLLMNNSKAPSWKFIVPATIESIIVVLLTILIIILTINLIIKRRNSQVWKPNSVRSKSDSKSKNTYV